MSFNLGFIDRGLRILAGLVTYLLFFLKVIDGALAIVLISVSTILLLTGIAGSCPIYKACKINTNRIKQGL